MILRTLANIIENNLFTGKAIIVLGARQVGKTTMIKSMFQNNEALLWLNADETDIQNLFKDMSSTRFKAIFGNKKTASGNNFVLQDGRFLRNFP